MIIFLLFFNIFNNFIYLLHLVYFITRHLIISPTACSIILTRILITHFTFLINFNDAMTYLLIIVKRLELYMDLALYKINILLLLLLAAIVRNHTTKTYRSRVSYFIGVTITAFGR